MLYYLANVSNCYCVFRQVPLGPVKIETKIQCWCPWLTGDELSHTIHRSAEDDENSTSNYRGEVQLGQLHNRPTRQRICHYLPARLTCLLSAYVINSLSVPQSISARPFTPRVSKLKQEMAIFQSLLCEEEEEIPEKMPRQENPLAECIKTRKDQSGESPLLSEQQSI